MNEMNENDYKMAYLQSLASPVNQNSQTILQMTDPQAMIEEFRLGMKGIEIDYEGNEKKISEPLLNDIGIRAMIAHAKSLVNQDTIMSHFNEKQVKALINFNGQALIRDMLLNAPRYELKIYNKDKIHTMFMNLAYATAFRSNEGGERRFWKGSQQEITQRIEGINNQKKGFFSKLLGG